jgi:hypothetical protein
VYDCRWGTDTIRVIVAGELPRETHNAPLHLFSASPELVSFGRSAYQRRSENTSALLRQLLERFQEEGIAMTFTMEDFQRQYAKEHFPKLTPQEQAEALQALPPEEQEKVLQALPPQVRRRVLQSLPAEELMTLLSADQIQQLRDRLATAGPTQPRKSRRKK